MRRRKKRSRKISVLVVDDDPALRRMVRLLLEDGGYGPVWEAADGSSALDEAYRLTPDLVILDYLLPKLDGEAVAKAFRLLTPDSYLFVLSGVLTYPPAWGDGYLHKMEIANLLEALDAIFGPGGRQRGTK